MTLETTERYLESLQAELRTELVKTPDDDDVYQQASMDVLRDCHRYQCPTPYEFRQIFCRYFLTIRSRWRFNERRSQFTMGKPVSLGDYCDMNGECFIIQYSTDPRKDPQTEALEFIEYLPLKLRRIFVLLYVEGLTQYETAQILGMSPSRMDQLIEEGLQWIRDEIRATAQL